MSCPHSYPFISTLRCLCVFIFYSISVAINFFHQEKRNHSMHFATTKQDQVVALDLNNSNRNDSTFRFLIYVRKINFCLYKRERGFQMMMDDKLFLLWNANKKTWKMKLSFTFLYIQMIKFYIGVSRAWESSLLWPFSAPSLPWVTVASGLHSLAFFLGYRIIDGDAVRRGGKARATHFCKWAACHSTARWPGIGT